MQNKLQQVFPTIKNRREVLEEIRNNPRLMKNFQEWSGQQQEYFLSFVTGAKGIKLLYDSFFKEIMNPEAVPERMDRLLSLILKKEVKILQVLPVDNTRLGDETSLVIMDIVVKLEDGSIVDVEVQKIGYLFPGQRSACYSADLLLRQYKAARQKKKENRKRFSYKDVKPVYTIVFFEKSPKEFHAFPNIYLHNSSQQTDTGLKLELLQNFVFIPLDIFHKNLHNKGITNDLDAWLAFLSMDDPETILELIHYHPDFKAMYSHLYDLCGNIERVMGMFSKELQEMDKNTVQLMIDELQDTIDSQKDTIDSQKQTLIDKDNIILDKERIIEQLQQTIRDMKKER